MRCKNENSRLVIIKINAALRVTPFLAAILFSATAIGVASELPNGATLLDPDLVWEIESLRNSSVNERDPSFAISPDDQWIAYISKGVIWKCNVLKGPPIKLVAVPDTITALLADPAWRYEWENIRLTKHSVDRGALAYKLRPKVRVHSLTWTPIQDGVVFALSEPSSTIKFGQRYHVMRTSNESVTTPITIFDRSTYDRPGRLTKFFVTRDKRFVIVSDYYIPLIVDTTSNKPRVTPFDALTSSSSSGRSLGIEIDTRQLVLADEDFRITKRFDVTLKAARFCDVIWSSDERYAICREFLDSPSEGWEGFRIDLKTGDKRPLKGEDKMEQCSFTGNAGEFVRIPPRYGPVQGFKFITVAPEGDGPERELVQWPSLLLSDDWDKCGRCPDACMTRDFNLFALPFLRDRQTPGYQFFFVNREGQETSLMTDLSEQVSPYTILAIVNHGQTIVACDDTRLFSIPVDAAKSPEAPPQ